MGKTCIFLGNNNILDASSVLKDLNKQLENLIYFGVNNFICGYYGDFNMMALITLKNLKEKFNNINISVYKAKYGSFYFEKNKNINVVEFPNNLDYQNQNLMVNLADYIVCYINEEQKDNRVKYAYNRAKKLKKNIINLFNKNSNICSTSSSFCDFF